MAALDLGHFSFKQSVVHPPCIPLGTADSHQHAVFEQIGRIATTHHRRNTQFAGDDGGVAGAPAPVGDDGRSPFHDRLPVGVGHVGHQHIARLDLVHLADVVHNPDRAGANFLANSSAFHNHCALALELVTVLRAACGLALHGLGARLQNIDFAVQSVLTPLDVHGPAVVLLDDQCISRQLFDIGIGQGIAVAQLGRHIRSFDQFATGRFFFGGRELHLDQLGAQIAPDQGTLARLEHGLVHIELIRIHSALHHRLAQPVAGGDEHHVFKTGLGVNREHDAGRAHIGAHHALNARTQGNMLVRKTLVHAVADGPVVVKAGKHFPDFVQHFFDADDIQKGFLLARKGGIRQVFSGRRRTHGKRSSGVVSTQGGECRTNRQLKVSGKWLYLDHGPNLCAHTCQSLDVLGIQRTQMRVDSTREVFKGQKLPKGVRSGGESGGDFDAGRQVGNHLAEAGVFTANRIDVGHSQVFKRYDQVGRAEKCRHGEAPEVKSGISQAARLSGDVAARMQTI